MDENDRFICVHVEYEVTVKYLWSYWVDCEYLALECQGKVSPGDNNVETIKEKQINKWMSEPDWIINQWKKCLRRRKHRRIWCGFLNSTYVYLKNEQFILL